MKTDKLLWIPRILAITFILFISLFALDVFDSGEIFFRQLVGFLIHLIPSFVLIIILIISWRKPLIGGIIFILLGVAFTFLFNTYKAIPHFLTISLPLFVVGILFILFRKMKT